MPHFIPVQARDATSTPSRLERPPCSEGGREGWGPRHGGTRSRGDAVTLSVSPGWAGGVSSVEVFGLVSSSR